MSDFCYRRPIIDRIFQQTDLMDRMMERLGVSPLVAACHDSGMAWFAGRTKCIDCEDVKSCQEWLATAPSSRIAPDFCPNARFFQACKATTSNWHGDLNLPASHASDDGGGQADNPAVFRNANFALLTRA